MPNGPGGGGAFKYFGYIMEKSVTTDARQEELTGHIAIELVFTISGLLFRLILGAALVRSNSSPLIYIATPRR